MVHKVLAYITRGRELLLFEHAGMPAAGLQVPAGTVEPDEPLDDALWREIGEESGLTPAQLQLRTWFAPIPHPTFAVVRHYAWLSAAAALPEAWSHAVGGAGEDRGLVFVYRWEQLPPPTLADRMDETVAQLLAAMANERV